MKARVIPSSWLRRPGLRLGAAAYTSGAIEARQLLESLGRKSEPLIDLTRGHQGGIYRPPIFQMQFSRNLVDSASHGVPFLTSTAMLLTDLRNLPLVSKKVAQSKKFGMLRLSPGMTLISCSGTIGRAVYSRPDMDGVWSSQDIIKVNPDPDRVPPGYVFAFLASRFGVPLLTSGTYGAIVQHIEREHLLDVPVPRLGNRVEQAAHSLIEEAAVARSDAIKILSRVEETLLCEESQTGAPPRPWNVVSSTRLQSRCDAYYFSPACEHARSTFDLLGKPASMPLQRVANVFIPGIFKRRYADDPNAGRPYITGADVFQSSPTSDRYLMHKVVEEHQLAVKQGMILIQEAGQLGGLIGRSVFVGRRLDGFAVSNNMVRVEALDPQDAGYIYAVLSCPVGVTLLSREAAGSSIPHLDAGRVRQLEIPWPSKDVRTRMSAEVDRATALQDRACEAEEEARALVEKAIEEAA